MEGLRLFLSWGQAPCTRSSKPAASSTQSSPGDEIKIEKIDGGVGDSVTFDKVVAVSDEDGTLHAGNETGGSVSATISGHGRHKKIDVFKFKRRKMYRRRMGHRQSYTQVRIESISGQ